MKSEVIPLEQLPPGLKSVLDYWQELGGDNMQCAWKTFDLLQVPSVLLPTTMVVDVWPDMNKNRFRFWGSGMTQIHGRDMTGKSPYDLTPKEFAETLRRDHLKIFQKRTPSAYMYGFERLGGFEHIQTVLRLPLSDDGETVNRIVVVVELTDKGIDHWKDPAHRGNASR